MMRSVNVQRRFDRLIEDVAATRARVEAIHQSLAHLRSAAEEQRTRLGRLERQVFALWVIGPALMGAVATLKTFRTWLLEN
jgi:hypothetical protein